MSNRSIRIKTDPNVFEGKNLKINLEQDFDFLEILSLSISQSEIYRRFCSDYGVVVGRVIMNNGVGVPNAKVSIFIPLDDNDITNDEISGLYPFEIITDKDSEGKSYNLLPNTSQFNCHTPVGSLSNKREILDNDIKLNIHCKYYKYSAITNAAGDFMIFGVPTGTHFINVDCDLSDIGIYSQRPYDFMSAGQPREAFESSNKFKGGDDLNKLNQIKRQQTSINVNPFWGDDDQCSIGISRIDIDLKHELKPSAIFMGGIFGDNEKNSFNKRCRPRKKLGKLCETITGLGSIDMLRKDLNGNIQEYPIEGGRVIDENGAWAYQIPMNLDYMVTDEYGNLIPTDDPTRGIPTRARVRFKIGMDVSGGEGKLRTRAKHLVPHNPETYSDSDYSFNESTKDENFRDLYWNKIYSIKQFIPRFQTLGGVPIVGGINPDVDVRAMMGIKDVDDCTGTHNPFPFNRMDSDVNPLFSILCVIIQTISFLVVLINNILIRLLNVVIKILNDVLSIICKMLFFIGGLVCALKHLSSESNRESCRRKTCITHNCPGSCDNCECGNMIDYIPCITLSCKGDDYGPGCYSTTIAWDTTDKPPMKYWPNDGSSGHDTLDTAPIGDGGWAFCVSISIAQSLNVWEFDFYNDWINGVLYAPLLKYKKKRQGKEKFCEYDCRDFGGGVDSDNNGNGDNRCHNNWLVDSCTTGGVKTGASVQIRDGIVKSYLDELYYAVFTHETGYKLMSTDIINLGAVFACDWQGKPKIQESLVVTSYKTPELLHEYDDYDRSLVVTSGFDSPKRGGKYSLFFNLSCLGLFTNSNNCVNIKRQCEIGVGLNEDRQDELPQTGCVGGPYYYGVGGGAAGDPSDDFAYPIIDNCDIDFLYLRDSFTQLNNVNSGINLSGGNINEHALFTSNAYNKFRGFKTNEINQPWGGSYYFYFGLKPGKTGLDKMNSKYFEECITYDTNDFIISCDNIVDTSTYGGNDGSINITIIGGTGPFTYSWSNGATTEDLNNITSGTYTVTVTDSEGLSATQSCSVGQPFSVNCFATPVAVTQSGNNDGSINIVGISGGIGPYKTTIIGPAPSLSVITHNNITGPTDIFNGLGVGSYTVTTEDSTNQTTPCSTTNIIITSPPPLIITATVNQITCNNQNNGVIDLNYTSGVPPISYNTSAINYMSNTNSTLTNLPNNTYTTIATDGINQTTTIITVLNNPPAITATLQVNNITCNGNNDGSIIVNAAGGTGPLSYSWVGNSISPILDTTPYLNNIGSGNLMGGTYTVTIKDSNGCVKSLTVTVLEPDVINISTINMVNTTCNGGSDGSISINISGGNPDINIGQYEVNIGSGWVTEATNQHIFNNLTAGNHTITVRDTEHNCVGNTLNIVVGEPPVTIPIITSVTKTTINVIGSGGNSGPYQFRINSGSWQTNGNFNGLICNTNYNIECKDSTNCLSTTITTNTNPC